MDRQEARQALKFARQWHLRNLLPTTSLVQLEKEYGPAANDSQAESFGSGVLYALGGILLGAAAFALIVLLQDNGIVQDIDEASPWILLVWGLACFAIGLTIDLLARKPALGDSFHVAALVAMAACGYPQANELALGYLGMLFALGVLVYRRQRFMVPFLAIVSLNVAWGAVMDGGFWPLDTDDAAFGAWFAFALAQLLAVIAVSRMTKWPWPTVSLSGLTLLVAGSFLAFYFESVSEHLDNFRGDIEIYLAVLMGLLLACGLALREKGIVLASAFAIAIDAIVFAFDVGEIIGGLVAILAVAGLLIWQAGALRAYLRE